MSEADPINALMDIQKLMQSGKFDQALARTEKVILDHPTNVDPLFLKAVCLRYLKEYDKAFASLDEVKELVPEFGRAFQEEGHLYKAKGNFDLALQAYRRACQFNPALIASWQSQADILKQKGGDPSAIQGALAQVSRLKAMPRELIAVTNMLYERKLLKAENLCRQFLRANPTHTEGMRLLALIGEKFGAFDEAEYLLESAVEFEPDVIQLRLDYLQMLRKKQKFSATKEQAEYLHDRDPSNTTFLAQLAISEMQLGNNNDALKHFEAVQRAEPGNAENLVTMGHVYKTMGRQEDGINAYQKAYGLRPNLGEAYFSLSNLKTYKFSDDELSSMHAQVETGNLTYHDKIQFLFALGKAHEDRKQFEQSFSYYEQANTLGRLKMRYNAENMTKELAAQKTVCTTEFFSSFAGSGNNAKDPIFIVGLPRAGSTLLEQIVASHSLVDGTMELGNILSMAHRLRGKGMSTERSEYPAALKDLSFDQLAELGQKFIEDTQIHRQGAPHFIDKMPNNFRHIGLIHLILPNAKIIDARRHPMACCFSGFKQHFAQGQEFTYGLEQIGTYYRDYVDLMDHWDSVLPGKILRVQYEDVVAETETQVRRVLNYLGLPFEQACVDFHKSKRSVRTASSEQVRQPIFKSGLEQWRNFEPWLDPLKKALGPALDRYPIT